MMLAFSSSTSLVMCWAARSTSYKVRSAPPVMFTSMPLAERTLMSPPSKGFLSASEAARTARSSPSACPLGFFYILSKKVKYKLDEGKLTQGWDLETNVNCV